MRFDGQVISAINSAEWRFIWEETRTWDAIDGAVGPSTKTGTPAMSDGRFSGAGPQSRLAPSLGLPPAYSMLYIYRILIMLSLGWNAVGTALLGYKAEKRAK